MNLQAYEYPIESVKQSVPLKGGDFDLLPSRQNLARPELKNAGEIVHQSVRASDMQALAGIRGALAVPKDWKD
jgi:hypothetical protein